MCFIGVEVEQETSAPPPKKNPGSAPGFQTKMGKEYTRFQTKNDAKTPPDGAAHTYIAYIGEYPHFGLKEAL